MILVVGERINARQMEDCRAAGWLDCWDRHGWDAAIRLEARGGSLNRLEGLLPEHRVVNLLPPDNKCGTWDEGLARKVADQAIFYFGLPVSRGGPSDYEAVVLLGKRVAKAFFGSKVEFGHIEPIGKLFALCMPHPSGRSRFWNDAGARDKVRGWVRELRSHLRTPGPHDVLCNPHRCVLGIRYGTSPENQRTWLVRWEKDIAEHRQKLHEMPYYPEALRLFNFCPECGRKNV